MNTRALGLVLLLGCGVPLAACNQQAAKKEARFDRDRGDRGGRGHGLKRACAADLQKYCAGQDRGRERRECLQSHVDQLSADCKEAVAKRGGGRHRRRDL